MKRRHFLKQLAELSALTATTPFIQPLLPFPREKLRILVLGGTQFVGPAIVNAALSRKHEVTLFNRGITNPQLFPELAKIRGDRKEGPAGYAEIPDQTWDVVIDVWPEKSKLVEEASQLLQRQTRYYIFVSSIAVYQDFNEVGLNESSAVVKLPEDREQWYYPEEKLVAEKIIKKRFPNNHTIVRPGPIKGWRDPALDLSYWISKMKRGGEILAPGTGRDPIQFIDVKDVGRFIIKSVEEKLVGTFNTTGPQKEPLLWKDFLETVRKTINPKAKLTWVSEPFLAENKVRSFEDIPLWAPLSEDRGFMQISMDKANTAGFRHRPLKKTLKDVLAWFENEHDEGYQFGTKYESVGLDRERELALLKAWAG